MGVAYKAIALYKSMAAMIQFKLANMVDKVGVETMSYTTPIFHIALLVAYGGVAFYRMVLYMALYILCLRLR